MPVGVFPNYRDLDVNNAWTLVCSGFGVYLLWSYSNITSKQNACKSFFVITARSWIFSDNYNCSKWAARTDKPKLAATFWQGKLASLRISVFGPQALWGFAVSFFSGPMNIYMQNNPVFSCGGWPASHVYCLITGNIRVLNWTHLLGVRATPPEPLC